MPRIDFNSDLGEDFGVYSIGMDSQIMEQITSANVACGFHAGDPSVMRKTVATAKEKGVAVGAHPGYPDLLGFGRRSMKCKPEEVYDYCLYQIGALMAFAALEGVAVQHVKAHGALYNDSAKSPEHAEAIAQATRDAGRGEIILMGLANTAFGPAAEKVKVPFAAEAFADRAYQSNGHLVPRGTPGAVLHDPAVAAQRVLGMITDGTVESIDGEQIALRPTSICLHGDTGEAVEMSASIRRHLEEAGVSVVPMKELVGR
ncbi:MAG: LamB/YcsF family protein [Synergistales bacterium]|nr:LamB/YcsF family protein [Synergistales bacterium]